MDCFEAIKERRSCRNYSNTPVPLEVLERLAFIGGRAPTACNLPRRHFIVVDDVRIIKSIRQMSPSLRACPPSLIVVITDKERERGEAGPMAARSSLIDSGAAGENIVLAAVALGLGSQFTMTPFTSGIAEILQLPEHFQIDLIIPIGYPESAVKSQRAQMNANRVYHNKYGEQFEHRPETK